MTRQHCINPNCFAKIRPKQGLEPNLCEDCSILVVNTRLKLLNDLRPALVSDIYWSQVRINLNQLRELQD